MVLLARDEATRPYTRRQREGSFRRRFKTIHETSTKRLTVGVVIRHVAVTRIHAQPSPQLVLVVVLVVVPCVGSAGHFRGPKAAGIIAAHDGQHTTAPF